MHVDVAGAGAASAGAEGGGARSVRRGARRCRFGAWSRGSPSRTRRRRGQWRFTLTLTTPSCSRESSSPGVQFFLVDPKSCFHAGDFVARRGANRFVVAHEWKVKTSVGADVLGGPGCGRPRTSAPTGGGYRGSLGQRHRVFHSKKALVLRCSEAEVGQDRASGFDLPNILHKCDRFDLSPSN